MSETTRPPLPRTEQMRYPAGTVIGGERVGGRFIPNATVRAVQQQTAAATNNTTTSTTQTNNQQTGRGRSIRRAASRIGRRAAQITSGALFGFGAPITQRIGRGLAGNRRQNEYQNASAMMELPASGEAERAQEVQSRATLNIISETLIRIENTVNNIAAALLGRSAQQQDAAGGGSGGLLSGIGNLLRNLLGAGAGALGARALSRLGGNRQQQAPRPAPRQRQTPQRQARQPRATPRERPPRAQRPPRPSRTPSAPRPTSTPPAPRVTGPRAPVSTPAPGLLARAAPVLGATAGVAAGAAALGAIGYAAYQAATMSPEERAAIQERAAQQAQTGIASLTPGEREGRGVGNALARNFYDQLPQNLSLEDVIDTLDTPAPNETPEQRTTRERLSTELSRGNGRPTSEMIQYVIERRAAENTPSTNRAAPGVTTNLVTQGRSMDEELNFSPTAAAPTAAPATTPAATPTAPERVRPEEQSNSNAQPAATRVENFRLQDFRRADPEGAREYQNRLRARTQELEREFNSTDLQRARGTADRARITEANRVRAQAQAEREILSDPVIAERINRSGAGNITVQRQTEANAPSPEPVQQPPTDNMVPTSNAEDRARALSESAPSPTVIPVPVPQPVPSSSGGGGGRAASGGGAGPTSVGTAQMQPPSHPIRPADIITPQVGGR